MRRLAVYCGSNPGVDPAFVDAALAVGSAMAERGIELVYGGGRLGMMGVAADAVLAGGGKVHGVIPRALVDLEVAHTGLTELYVVESMHERKAKMTELADAFVCLPGGIGTLDELFEAWTWHALGYHSKPLALLNISGFWDGLVDFLDGATAAGLISPARRSHLLVSDTVEDVLDKLDAAGGEPGGKVIW